MERLEDQIFAQDINGGRIARIKNSASGVIDTVGYRVGEVVDLGERLHDVVEEYRAAISTLDSAPDLKNYRETLEATDGKDLTHNQRMSVIMSLGDVGKGLVADEISNATSDVLRLLPQKKVAQIGRAGVLGVYGVTQIAKGAANLREAASLARGKDKTDQDGEVLTLEMLNDLEQERDMARDAVLSFFNSGSTSGKKGMPGVRKIRFVHSGVVAIGSDVRESIRVEEEGFEEPMQLAS